MLRSTTASLSSLAFTIAVKRYGCGDLGVKRSSAT
jgi:hypothetical protein